jgi:3-hydroxyisobutyrate dehydrogenase
MSVGDIGAKNGNLVVMIGGPKEGVDKALPLLQCYSSKIEHLGDAGAGQHAKAANQIMIASSMIGTCEGLIYGYKAGLPLDRLIDLLAGGGAGSFTLSKLGPRMLRRDFDPGFYVEHFVKDLGIALEEARKMNISLPATALATQFYTAMIAQGGGRLGTQGLLTVLERFNNVTVPTYK